MWNLLVDLSPEPPHATEPVYFFVFVTGAAGSGTFHPRGLLLLLLLAPPLASESIFTSIVSTDSSSASYSTHY
jgi:hypothetical protein